MSKQEQILPGGGGDEGVGLTQIAKKLGELKRTKTKNPPTRKVRLFVRSQCNCGGGEHPIEREVDWDSPLKDGDTISESQFLSTDVVL